MRIARYKEGVRSGALLTVLGAVVLITTGCSATPAAAPTTSAPSPSPTATPLPTPSARAGEILRSTFEQGVIDAPSARLPDVAALYVEVACSGPSASTMRWALQGADGTPFGPSGEQDCTGPPTTSGLGIAGDTPARIEVPIVPGTGVTAGYAIVRRDSP